MALSFEEGKQSIYGVRHSYVFNDGTLASNNSRIIHRDTYNSNAIRRTL